MVSNNDSLFFNIDKKSRLLIVWNNSSLNEVVVKDDEGKLKSRSIGLGWDIVIDAGFEKNCDTPSQAAEVVLDDDVVSD